MYSVKCLDVSAIFENITACCLNLIFIRKPNQSPPINFCIFVRLNTSICSFCWFANWSSESVCSPGAKRNYKISYSVKKAVFFILTLSVVSTLFGQVPPDYRYLKMIRISERFADVDSIPADSAHLNFQNNDPIDRFSISNSWNGNLGSPLQSRLYFDRPENTDFIFANAYYP